MEPPNRVKIAMKKITLTDLMPAADYEKIRPAIRQAIMEHKKTRRVALGPNATLHFEDYMLMRYQVLEMIRAEKLSDEGELEEELKAYNPLIPDGSNLKVTFMLEYPDENERRERLRRLIGIERQVHIQIGDFEPVYAIANEDLSRTTDEKTSAVHFLRYEFSRGMIAAARAGARWAVRSEHPEYRHSTEPVPAEVTESLLRDFD